MRRRLRMLAAALAILACTDPGPGIPELELQIIAPGPGDALHDLDPVLLVGEARAADLGLLPDDSILWTHDGDSVGRGRQVAFRLRGGSHRLVLHGRWGIRSDSAVRILQVAGDGLGRVLWTVTLDTLADALAFDPRGTLYAGDRDGQVLVAINLDGSVRWRTETGATWGTLPVIGPDRGIHIGYIYGETGPAGQPGGVLAFNPDGTRRWLFTAADHAPAGGLNYHSHGGVAIDAAGIIYFVTDEWTAPVYSINPDGSLRWRVATLPVSTGARFWSHATLGNGAVVSSIRNDDSLVVAATADGAPRWRVASPGAGYCNIAPAVGADGTIYVTGSPTATTGSISAATPNGEPLWETALPVPLIQGSPVVGPNGIYFAAPNGAVSVYSLSGAPVATLGPAPAEFYADGISLAANGVVYVAANDTLLSYDAAGNRRFASPIPHVVATSCYSPQGGPVIGPDGTVYVRASNLGVMAFRDTVGPATDAPWPTLQGNFQRTGRRATDQ